MIKLFLFFLIERKINFNYLFETKNYFVAVSIKTVGFDNLEKNGGDFHFLEIIFGFNR